jgi:prepilin-type N-terminal cleavage/methylation domain-containing protein
MTLSTRRAGFTLVELLIVVMLGAIILGAAVQSLVTQERTHRATGEMIRGQDALRIALGVLETELREVTSSSAAAAGGSDLLVATPDSLKIRAQRKLAIVCSVHPSDRRIFIWSPSPRDTLVDLDSLVLFADGLPETSTDDVWLPARVSQKQAAAVACPPRPVPSPTSTQRVDLAMLDGTSLSGTYLDRVRPGAPIRVFEEVTYGLYEFDGEWGLGMRRASEPGTVHMIVRGLAGPGAGLILSYLDNTGAVITADPIPTATVAGVRITGKTKPRPGSGANAAELTTNVFFRNN